MVDRVELDMLDQTQEVRHLDRERRPPASALRPSPPTKSLRSGTWARTLFATTRSAASRLARIVRASLGAEELDLRRDACGDRDLGDVRGRLDARAPGCPPRRSSGAGSRRCSRPRSPATRRPSPSALGGRLGVARAHGRASFASRTRSRRSPRRSHPRRHDFVDLDEQALLADAGMQRIARLVAGFELLASQESVGERLLAEVDEGVPKRRRRRTGSRARRSQALLVGRDLAQRPLAGVAAARSTRGTSRPSSRASRSDRAPAASRPSRGRASRPGAGRESRGRLRGFVLTPARPAAEAGAQTLHHLGDRHGAVGAEVERPPAPDRRSSSSRSASSR